MLDYKGTTLKFWYRVSDVKAIFGLSHRWIYERLADGRISARKNGRTTLVDTASVIAAIEAMKTY